MASRRASLASLRDFGSSAPITSLPASAASGALQRGQRLAKPGLSGLSSNSSSQTTQVLMGKGIRSVHDTTGKVVAAAGQPEVVKFATRGTLCRTFRR